MMMKKSRIIRAGRMAGIFICVSFTLLHAQNPRVPGLEKAVRKQAMEMAGCLAQKDYACFTAKMYPPLVEQAGGKEKFIMGLSRSVEEMRSRGTSIDSVSILKVYKIVSSGNELQTSLSELVVMTVPKGKIVSKSSIIAISSDKGKTWYFMDATGRDLKSLRTQFTNLSSKLYIPPFEKPMGFGN